MLEVFGNAKVAIDSGFWDACALPSWSEARLCNLERAIAVNVEGLLGVLHSSRFR